MKARPPHGHLEMSVEGRLLVVERCGPFNLEFSKLYVERTASIVDQLDAGGPYALMIVYRDSMLSTPEAVQFIMDRARTVDARRKNCIGQAVVAGPEVEGRTLFTPLVSQYFELRGMTAETGKFFDSYEDGKAFLLELLAARDRLDRGN